MQNASSTFLPKYFVCKGFEKCGHENRDDDRLHRAFALKLLQNMVDNPDAQVSLLSRLSLNLFYSVFK